MSMTNQATTEHDRVVTALFDTRAAAEKAKVDVVAAGVPAHDVTITGGAATGTTGKVASGGTGFWDSLKNIFAPEEDKYVYEEGLKRGGVLLTVHTSEANYDRILHIVDAEGAVDMSERESQWRSEGWTGHEARATTLGTSTAAAGTGTMGTSTAAAGLGARNETVATERTGVMGGGTATGSTVGALGGTGEESIQLAEERLRVGKRDVNHGRVRLRSYVVEKPVNESVNLHSERIDVSRHPVDRALGAGENLFQERTISAEEHDEEAVVSKEARVVEEISLGKVAQDRTQEIHDTVRKTEVEVDDGRTGHVGGRTAVETERTTDAPLGKNRPL